MITVRLAAVFSRCGSTLVRAFGFTLLAIAQDVVLLLCGGDKSTQRRDIQRAISYLTDYKERS